MNEYNRVIKFPRSPYKLKSWGRRTKGTKAPQRSKRKKGYKKVESPTPALLVKLLLLSSVVRLNRVVVVLVSEEIQLIP